MQWVRFDGVLKNHVTKSIYSYALVKHKTKTYKRKSGCCNGKTKPCLYFVRSNLIYVRIFKPNVRERTKPTKQAVINLFSSSTNPTTFYSTVKVKSPHIRQVKKPFSSSPNPKANNFRPCPNLATFLRFVWWIVKFDHVFRLDSTMICLSPFKYRKQRFFFYKLQKKISCLERIIKLRFVWHVKCSRKDQIKRPKYDVNQGSKPNRQVYVLKIHFSLISWEFDKA